MIYEVDVAMSKMRYDDLLREAEVERLIHSLPQPIPFWWPMLQWLLQPFQLRPLPPATFSGVAQQLPGDQL